MGSILHKERKLQLIQGDYDQVNNHSTALCHDLAEHNREEAGDLPGRSATENAPTTPHNGNPAELHRGGLALNGISVGIRALGPGAPIPGVCGTRCRAGWAYAPSRLLKPMSLHAVRHPVLNVQQP